MKIIFALFAILVNTFAGVAIGYGLDINPVIPVVGLNGIGVAMSFVKIAGVRATVYTEIWTSELVKQFSHADTATFLSGIPDYSRYVENDIIHLVKVGIDPEVLINNTTYPIPIVALEDEDIPVSLDKLTTKTTPITDDELYALSYDKVSSVKERHGNAITETKHDKAIHAIAPAAHTSATPVLSTTGEDDGNGRARLTIKDVVALKKAFDDVKIPTSGRRLVLCHDHVNDLLLEDQKFANQYYNYTTGKIANLMSFEIFEYVSNPYYSAAGAKKAFSAVPADTDYRASVAFFTKSMFKAIGSTKMYWSPAANDTEYHRNKVNFEHRAIVLPKTNAAIGAIRSVVFEAVQ